MEPRFTRGEYWLLETVVECEFEVCVLIDSIVPDESKPPRTEPVDVRKITSYGLTQEGSAQWEAFAAPDWQKYIAQSVQPEDEEGEYEMWELICGDKSWLERTKKENFS